MTNGCVGSVGALSSCNIKITFNPTATGRWTGTIVITDSAPGSPRTITLSGTGVSAAAPQATVMPTSLTFASQALGTTSAAQNINLTNSGEAEPDRYRHHPHRRESGETTLRPTTARSRPR